jgi:hypothetical protein
LNIVSIATATAAGLAAVLSGVNLWLAGRREINKWVRETLIEIFTMFLDASFTHASACRRILLSESRSVQERRELQQDIFKAHAVASQALTHLRLLAPPSVVDNAITLLEAEYNLAVPCFFGPPPGDETLELVRAVRSARARMLVSARSSLNLRETRGTGNFDLNMNWRDLRTQFNQSAMDEERGEP